MFDLPPVISFTQEIIAYHGMQGRMTARPGNYFYDDFTGGNDLVLLSNKLQSEGVDTCRMLLCKVFKALVPGGQLVIHGIMPHSDRVPPRSLPCSHCKCSCLFPMETPIQPRMYLPERPI